MLLGPGIDQTDGLHRDVGEATLPRPSIERVRLSNAVVHPDPDYTAEEFAIALDKFNGDVSLISRLDQPHRSSEFLTHRLLEIGKRNRRYLWPPHAQTR